MPAVALTVNEFAAVVVIVVAPDTSRVLLMVVAPFKVPVPLTVKPLPIVTRPVELLMLSGLAAVNPPYISSTAVSLNDVVDPLLTMAEP